MEEGNAAKARRDTVIRSIEQAIEMNGEAGRLSEAESPETPEEVFQRTWAESLLTRVLDRLAEEFASRGDERFEVLRGFLAVDEDAPSLREGAARLNLSVPAFKSALHRFRQRYREILLAEVSQTVANPGEVEEEIRDLMAILSK